MDIIIGPTHPVVLPGKRGVEGSSGPIEAKVLNVRAPRRRRGKPPSGEGERRTRGQYADPANGRVMVLLIPEGHKVPRDIESGDYKIFLRFVPKRG